MRKRRYKAEIYVDAKDRWRWRIKAGNNQVVQTSHQSFASKSNAKRNLRALGYAALSEGTLI